MKKAFLRSCQFLILVIPLLSLSTCFLFGASATGVSMDRETLSVAIGESKAIAATVLPENANPSVSWVTDNQAVATVTQGGAVTGIAVGTATITVATVEGGFTDTCAVTVTVPVNVSGVTIPATAQVAEGYAVTLTPTITPANATFQAVTWSTSDPSIATVSANGVVTGLNPGLTTITVRTTDGSFTDTCDVTVLVPGEIIIVAY
jgi:uncharacterized protein YjdB